MTIRALSTCCRSLIGRAQRARFEIVHHRQGARNAVSELRLLGSPKPSVTKRQEARKMKRSLEGGLHILRLISRAEKPDKVASA